MRPQGALSIVVPTYNEADNVSLLVHRIDASLKAAGIVYEVIFIDDHSTDDTVINLQKLQPDFPVRVYLKHGKMGKAYSLLQGFDFANFHQICMIDADLQYPPEAIADMFALQARTGADIIQSRRIQAQTSPLRKFVSAGFNKVFTQGLFGFDYDTQSALKVFNKNVLAGIEIDPTPWSFDLEFIVRSLEQHYKIISFDIPFAERHAGEAKISIISASFEIAKASLKLRFSTSIKDVKRAYRRNLLFAARPFISLVLVSLIGLLVGAMQPQAQALQLNVGDINVNTSQLPILGQLVPETTSPTPAAASAPQSITTQPQMQESTAQPQMVQATASPVASMSAVQARPVQSPLQMLSSPATAGQAITVSARPGASSLYAAQTADPRLNSASRYAVPGIIAGMIVLVIAFITSKTRPATAPIKTIKRNRHEK